MKFISFFFRIRLEKYPERELGVKSDIFWIDDLTWDIKLKFGRRTLQSLIAVLNAMRMHKRFRDYDIIYVPSDFWAQVIGFVVARLQKIPFVIRLRGNPFEARRYLPSLKNRILTRIINIAFSRVDKAIYKRADLIISVCNDLAEKFRKLNRNVVTVWNGIDNRFIESKLKLRRKSDEIIFGYVGRISREKGVELMLKAIEDLPIRLLVFGEIQHPITFPKNIEYFGRVPHERIEEAYSRFDVLVLPSFTEGLPRTLQEAMLLGKAIICTDVGDNGLLIEKRGGWLCQPNVDSLRKAFYEALSVGKREILKMGIYNRHKAKKIFYNWEEYAKKVENIISQYLKPKI